MADYWLLRKQRINVPELYTTDPGGTYFYSRAINLRAIGALIPSAGDPLVFAFVPALNAFSAFSWFIAAGLGAVIYFVLADRTPQLRGRVRRAHRRREHVTEHAATTETKGTQMRILVVNVNTTESMTDPASPSRPPDRRRPGRRSSP